MIEKESYTKEEVEQIKKEQQAEFEKIVLHNNLNVSLDTAVTALRQGGFPPYHEENIKYIKNVLSIRSPVQPTREGEEREPDK